ncbi:DEAD/DEAH box helicase [Methanothermococcus sp.]|uniref:DEAD/DEAH box helicase n=1 Tax=Methanothermococcus sp. TaxID=2614238 RepID=UPI0025F86540|nr:DEAD/DEAH box helicase family protein [Methanothermococcus sp.]
MRIKTIKGTGDIPLKLAESISEIVNREWESGELLEKVTPTTRDLLMYWFHDSFCEVRNINFHEGQKQSILNTIYMHEVLESKNVVDLYDNINPELLSELNITDLCQDKHNHSKYCIKMATGTGKTWVLNALLIWQYLNAKHEKEESGKFSKNFLIVAPGLIVYERLLDAFLGKEQEDKTRNFEESDFKKYEELFIPTGYKDEIFGFIQSSVVKKEEIGKKVTGDGLIAITNWHLLAGDDKDKKKISNPLDDPSEVVKDILPITPGKAGGNDLNALDSKYFRGDEIEYLANLPSLVVFNDEAHHIHEIKKSGEVLEVEWQKSLNYISKNKKNRFIQIDFSATPYNVTGSKQKQKHYFPHIISNFDLKTAIQQGLVKTVVLDRRKEIANLELDYKAIRDENNKPIALSEGQKIMLRAGLTKLNMLENEFVKLTEENGTSNKHPKMLVICEDTDVAPLVTEFLKNEGLNEEDILEIHSNRKGEVKPDEWAKIKQRLFNIDKYKSPKVIVSVLMLREGFDVNNICVIVPLRSSQSQILLEQTIGRGLRLMWREKEYEDIKRENLRRMLIEKKEPSNYLDILSIIEHPAFIKFYDDYIKDGIAGVTTTEPRDKTSILGDIIKVPLKEDYEKYDLFIPYIIQDREEYVKPFEYDINKLNPFPIPLENLKKVVPKEESFISKELTVKTVFGEYKISSLEFNAKNYNEYIQKLVNHISNKSTSPKSKRSKKYPVIQANPFEIARLTDLYIRNRLFNQPFNPLGGNNWRILLLPDVFIHIMRTINIAIYEMQNQIEVRNAETIEHYFSEVKELKMRENYSLNVSKSIYEKLPYPSNKGGFEKNFMEFIDCDSEVEAFIKIIETKHTFAGIPYIREDGLLAHYYPDFMIKFANDIYLVETKAQKDLNNKNVQQKMISAINFVNTINELPPEKRDHRKWHYVLLGENTFYGLSEKGASAKEILEYAKMTESKVKGTLDDFLKN